LDKRTGLLYEPANSADLADKVRWLVLHPEEGATMGAAARAEYENKYTGARNYQLLIDIYTRVLGNRGSVSKTAATNNGSHQFVQT
jgi:glycosyltransferase involved in cell wall biosynthesis